MPRSLQINPVLNGWIVTCGCQTVLFTNLHVMTEEIKAYYTDPIGTTKRYLENKVNDTHAVLAPGTDRPAMDPQPAWIAETQPMSVGTATEVAFIPPPTQPQQERTL